MYQIVSSKRHVESSTVGVLVGGDQLEVDGAAGSNLAADGVDSEVSTMVSVDDLISNLLLNKTHLKIYLLLRPCERQNFPNFSFLRVSELFGYQSLEIFRKYPVSKFSKHYEKMTLKSNFKNREKLVPTLIPT